MRRETRLYFISGVILLASLGVALAWNTFADASGDAIAFHADTGLHASASHLRQTYLLCRAASIIMSLTGLGLLLFMILRRRRLK